MALKEDFQRAIAQSQQGKEVASLPVGRSFDVEEIDFVNPSGDDLSAVANYLVGTKVNLTVKLGNLSKVRPRKSKDTIETVHYDTDSKEWIFQFVNHPNSFPMYPVALKKFILDKTITQTSMYSEFTIVVAKFKGEK